MAAEAKEVDMKKMELMMEVRAHQVAIGELNNLSPSRAAYQKTCNIFFHKDIKSVVASQQTSLGQVYEGRLKETGELAAVKVQRPFVLETVTIDLFIIRNLGLVLKRFPQVALDVVGLVDEWATRFFDELDYVNKGENGTLFAEMMREDLPQVVVPKTYPEYTSKKVLTKGWVDGEKLSQSTEDDVGSLVNVGVIFYLKQLLDTGFFHADPHPGNMFRTQDGKLCILDFG